MNRDEFTKIQAEYEASGFPGICDRSSSECSPSKLATKMWSQPIGLAFASATKPAGEEIYLYCDFHAPKNAKNIGSTPSLPPAIRPENLLETVSNLSGPGLGKLRSRLGGSGQRGIHLRSTGDAANSEQSHIIFQTLDASPENPCLVTLDQHILDPFTGPGQFDLVERDAVRRVFDGASAGGTPVLSSATMNWQPGDADKIIIVGRYPGRIYSILSVEDPEHVTLSRNITLPSSELTLTMEGESEEAIATKSGFTDGATVGGRSHLEKAITADKVYRVDFVPGTTGDGIFSISVRTLYPGL